MRDTKGCEVEGIIYRGAKMCGILVKGFWRRENRVWKPQDFDPLSTPHWVLFEGTRTSPETQGRRKLPNWLGSARLCCLFLLSVDKRVLFPGLFAVGICLAL